MGRPGRRPYTPEQAERADRYHRWKIRTEAKALRLLRRLHPAEFDRILEQVRVTDPQPERKP